MTDAQAPIMLPIPSTTKWRGTWSLPRHDVLRIALDGVVNGDFDIQKLERQIFFLSTEQNYHGLEGVEPPYFPMDMYIERFY
jgi:hypothetical protein